jgi:dihydroorotase
MGVVGIETAFPVVYTYLVKTGLVPMETVLKALTVNPCSRFGLPLEGYSIWDLNERYTVDPSEFVSLGKATPFTGMEVQGRNLLTVLGGKVVWKA